MAVRQFCLFLILLESASSETWQKCCDRSVPCLCTCYKNQKRAVCSRLTFVPKLPDYVETVYYKNNTFPHISKQFFTNISTNKIKSLVFQNNSISEMSNDIFTDFIFLKHLEIRGETKLKSINVKNALQSFSITSLDTIIFEGNNWTYLPNNMFNSMATRNATVISLSINNLWNYSFEGFSHLSNLLEMKWSYNRLILFSVQGLARLQKLNLQYNNIVSLPNFCERTGKNSQVPDLKTLLLSNNALKFLQPESFICLPSLEYLNVDSNRIQVIVNNTFSLMPNLQKLFIRHNSQLRYIHPTAFNSCSLTHFYFSNNMFRFKNMNGHKRRYDANNIFRYTTNLRYLELTNNYLPKNNSELEAMFLPLSNITDLVLQSTGLKSIPGVSSFGSVRKLILQGNYIQSWDGSILKEFRNLEHLNLEGNYINYINQSSIPLGSLHKLKKLDLSSNHFSCNCDLMWFRNWIRTIQETKMIELINYPYRYNCFSPDSMKGIKIEDFNPTKESCNPRNPLYTMTIILSLFGFLVLIISVVAYKCHSNIRNSLYLLRLKRLRKLGYIPVENSEDFEYHAFVVYCDADREWVHTVLVKRLENEGIKLCIHHRDFDVGTSITTNIERFMSKCWKVIVVMSNEFAESEWCQWEVDFVQERRRKQGKSALVLLMLKTIDAHHMTSPIKTMLKTTPYLSVQAGFGEDLFWKTVTEGLREPITTPPMAV